MPVPDHIANRDFIIQAVKAELVGPSPQGKEIDCSGAIVFNDVTESYGPWRQKDTGEEILLRDSPTKRYGVGVLYPMGVPTESDETALMGSDTPTGAEANDEEPAGVGELPGDERLNEVVEELKEKIEKKKSDASSGEGTDDFDLSSANAYKPSSMAVSFVAEFPEGTELVVEASGGRYVAKDVQVAGRDRKWWLRQSVAIKARFSGTDICSASNATVKPVEAPETSNTEGLNLRVEVFSRPSGAGNNRLLTICLINRTPKGSSANGISLFQSHFRAKVIKVGRNHPGEALILPYPVMLRDRPDSAPDPEEKSIALLYRDRETFAVGHGCAADWEMGEGARAIWAGGEPLPQFETPSITSDVRRKNNSIVEVPMSTLAGLVPGDDGFAALSEVVDLYSQWIEEKESEISSLRPDYQSAARQHLDDCRACAARMQEGLAYLRSDRTALKAFQLANRAVLLQQVRGRREPRGAQYNAKTKRIDYAEAHQDPSDLTPPRGRGKWRAFQIAFLLMSIRSTAEPEAPGRRNVELIWFPTGGGKTEAYLGLAAFSIFIRRLKNIDDAGVHTLMRYTLRLLTAQQFQRASGLFCAMEYLRRQDEASLGKKEISIGIWLGGGTTPNTREQARQTLTQLQRGNRYTENKFLLSRCPWCRAQLGPLDYPDKRPRGAPKVIGYVPSGETVIFSCPDRDCEFNDKLPVYVIDEDIYEFRPSLVIGTVDKFAMLAWRPEARALFGIGANGERVASPPGLIIQDELHLISGPLGSLVGLYEAVIEELCTDRRSDRPVPPKIVSSTATIRRYREQVKGLYAREEVTLFPPPGLEASDSFFARYAMGDDGKLMRGRIYLGVHAPGLGSLQTVQVRAFTSLLQAPVPLSKEERDPWWTLLLFFNSLRELGTTLSLFQSDIPDYFGVLQQRGGLSPSALRRFWHIRELTGRLRSDEVPEAISALEVTCTNDEADPVDVCLASNIIEVGVDIDRLSLMAVVGQPKTTSQYIQVTGRVGRLWTERPGLIVTIYSASKPRDRSHFEKFRSYHERLYAQVEPTSVTPFSPPVLDRALHAVITAYARQAGDDKVANDPYPYPDTLIEGLRDIILPRVRAVDGAEESNFQRVFDERSREWERWKRTRWTGSFQAEDIPLLRAAGEYVTRAAAKISWPTPQSMRDVDAECQVEITQLFLSEEGSDVS
jgi:hypothetical protein